MLEEGIEKTTASEAQAEKKAPTESKGYTYIHLGLSLLALVLLWMLPYFQMEFDAELYPIDLSVLMEDPSVWLIIQLILPVVSAILSAQKPIVRIVCGVVMLGYACFVVNTEFSDDFEIGSGSIMYMVCGGLMILAGILAKRGVPLGMPSVKTADVASSPCATATADALETGNANETSAAAGASQSGEAAQWKFKLDGGQKGSIMLALCALLVVSVLPFCELNSMWRHTEEVGLYKFADHEKGYSIGVMFIWLMAILAAVTAGSKSIYRVMACLGMAVMAPLVVGMEHRNIDDMGFGATIYTLCGFILTGIAFAQYKQASKPGLYQYLHVMVSMIALAAVGCFDLYASFSIRLPNT